MKKAQLTILLTVGCVLYAVGQYRNISKQETCQLLNAIPTYYQNNNSLSINLNYAYYTESQPTKKLDSLTGTVNLLGKSYWLKLDNTETIFNGEYTIHLFEEDKLMYISKHKADENLNAVNPLLVDTTLFSKGTAFSIARHPDSTLVVKIDFAQGEACKMIEFHLNTNGSLLRSKTVVKTELLLEPNSGSEMDNVNYDGFAVVEITYSHYRKSPLGTSAFDSNNFFIKNSGNVLTTEKYKAYTPFIGSPKL